MNSGASYSCLLTMCPGKGHLILYSTGKTKCDQAWKTTSTEYVLSRGCFSFFLPVFWNTWISGVTFSRLCIVYDFNWLREDHYHKEKGNYIQSEGCLISAHWLQLFLLFPMQALLEFQFLVLGVIYFFVTVVFNENVCPGSVIKHLSLKYMNTDNFNGISFQNFSFP